MNHTASHRVLSLLLAVLFTPLETAALPRAGHVPAASTSREARRAGPVTVAVGSTGGEARARQLFAHALEQAIAQHPALRLQSALGLYAGHCRQRQKCVIRMVLSDMLALCGSLATLVVT